MLFRKLAKIIRGKATPFQIWSACILASMIGFMPGFMTAGGLVITLALLLIILNANLALGAIVGIVSKLLSYLLMPVSFAIGRFLLEGPTEGLFRSMVNAPVLALFGFEYYATTGGLVMGLIVGGLTGYLISRAIRTYRTKMKELETGSEKFQKYSQKGWVKGLTWVFLGGAPKKVDYDQLLAKKVGNPIRILGVIFAALTVLLLTILYQFAAEPIITYGLRTGLERANGATVDLQSAELNLKENRFTVNQLAMADPNALDTDLFRADQLVADISGMELLRKRLQLDKVVVVDGSSGQQRSSPGILVGPAPEPDPEPEEEIPGTKSIDDYIRDAKVWKERLAQIQEWIEKMGGTGEETPDPKSETWKERLEREIREKGYARVRAEHLIADAPTFTVLELTADEVDVAQLPEDQLNITGKNLSTHPRLLGAAPELVVRSTSGDLNFETRIGQFASGSDTNRIAFKYLKLPVDAVAGQLSINNTQPLSGGTMDVNFDGTFRFAGNLMVEFPMQVTLHDTQLQFPGMQPQPVDEFMLPIGVRGSLSNPRLQIDDKQLQDALVQAGVSRLKQELGDKAKEELGKQLDGQVGEAVGEEGKKLLDGLFNRKKEEQ